MTPDETLNDALASLNITTGDGSWRRFYAEGVEVGRGDIEFGWALVGHLRGSSTYFRNVNPRHIGPAGAAAQRVRNLRGTPLEIPA